MILKAHGFMQKVRQAFMQKTREFSKGCIWKRDRSKVSISLKDPLPIKAWYKSYMTKVVKSAGKDCISKACKRSSAKDIKSSLGRKSALLKSNITLKG